VRFKGIPDGRTQYTADGEIRYGVICVRSFSDCADGRVC
jgi:hypothetical protein